MTAIEDNELKVPLTLMYKGFSVFEMLVAAIDGNVSKFPLSLIYKNFLCISVGDTSGCHR